MDTYDRLGRINLPLFKTLMRMSRLSAVAGLIVLVAFIAASFAFGQAPAQWVAAMFVVLLLGSGMALRALAFSQFTALR